jgi:hypothetical protein
MSVGKFGLGPLSVLGLVMFLSAPTLAADACPPFEGKIAADLDNCIQYLQTRIASLETNLKTVMAAKFILGAGTVEQVLPAPHQPNVNWTGATAELEGAKGYYKVTFKTPLTQDAVVVAGATDNGTLAACAVTDQNNTDFFVQCRDKDGPAWAGFWFAVVSR